MTKLEYTNIFESITADRTLAADLDFRSDLIIALLDIFDQKGWTQADAADALGIPQPRISELRRAKVSLFSSDRLIGYLAKLGYHVQPTVSFDPTLLKNEETETA